MEEKDTKVVLSINDVDRIKSHIKATDQQLKELSNDFYLIEKRVKQRKLSSLFKRIKNIMKRIDVKSGINLLKIVLWIAMAWTIVNFSDDINAKIIGSLTYFMGLVIDMMLLRKQLPQDGYTILRLIVGGFSLVLWVIIVVLIINLMSISEGVEINSRLSSFIDIGLYSCGIFSTFLEFVNSIALDD